MTEALVTNKETILSFKNHQLLNTDAIKFVNTTDILSQCTFVTHKRSSCETDDSVLQLIPYVVINNPITGKIFSYRRGKASGEARLTSKCSIGLGGHLEETPAYNDYNTVTATIAMGVLRELNEEVGLELSWKNFNRIHSDIFIGNFDLFYLTRDNVDRYHLCMLLRFEASELDLPKLEDGVIQDQQWSSLYDLEENHKNGTRILEGWSDIALNILKNEL